MKNFLSLFAFVCWAVSMPSCSDVPQATPEGAALTRTAAGADVVLQWNNVEQTIDGFGIAQAGWSHYLWAHRHRDEIMDMFFGEDGMRLSILRGEVFPEYDPVSFNMDDDIDMPMDDPFYDIDYNAAGNEAANVDAKRRAQRWVTREAKLRGVDKLMFSTWTPPARWKSNGSHVKGYLKRAHYPDYAKFLSDFCVAYSNAGFPVYALSPANEPEYAAPWNSCLWLPGTTTVARLIIDELGPRLRQSSPATRIVIGELGQWTGILGFVMGSKNYVRDILNLNTRITNFPLIAAGHGYIDPVTKNDPGIEPFDRAEQEGLPVWLTEISDPEEPYDVTMTSGLKWAKKFHRYLTEANTGAIIWWAGALPDDWSTEGLIDIRKNREDWEVSKRCEVFGNFSRYIPVDSKRISAQYNPDLGWMVSGYKYGNQYTAVAINPSSNPVTITLTLDSAQATGDLQGYVTDDNRRWESIDAIQPVGGIYELTLPARSVVSYTGTIQ